jgi:hypothetical protein
MRLTAKDDENYAKSINGSYDQGGTTAQPPDAATKRVRVGTYVKTTLCFHILFSSRWFEMLSTMQYMGGTISNSTYQFRTGLTK